MYVGARAMMMEGGQCDWYVAALIVKSCIREEKENDGGQMTISSLCSLSLLLPCNVHWLVTN